MKNDRDFLIYEGIALVKKCQLQIGTIRCIICDD